MRPHAAVDFETTFFPKEKIGLKTMGVDQYLWHPRVEIYLVSIRTAEGSFVGHPAEFDWTQIADLDWVSHNAGFDRRVFRRLVHDYPEIQESHPKVWQCTANMTSWMGYPRDLKGACQAIFNVSLDKDARKKMENKTWQQMMGEGTSTEVLEYAERDALWCWKLWEYGADKWPTIEQKISEMTMQQVLRGLPCDRDYIDQAIKNLERACWDAKSHLPWTSGDDPSSVLSSIAVAEECRKIGITPPVSLAEDNQDCQAWEDEHPEIPWVREMRRYRKANLLMTKFITMRNQIRPFDGRIDFSQKYCGAHTKRNSGGSSGGKSFNVQGFQRDPFPCHDVNDPDAEPIFADMRRAIHAMGGGSLIVADLAQIEPRTLAWVCNDRVKLDLINEGFSVYQIHAIQTMGWNGGNLKLEDAHKYALAKMRVLGLSYGCGWKRFIAYCRDLYNYIITAQESRKQVNDFRSKERLIRQMWNKLGNAMEGSVGGDFELELPSWNKLVYRDVRRQGRNFLANLATGRVNRLWGSLLVENCLSGDTIIFTPQGRKRIIDLESQDLVWDGIDWVSHGGICSMGNKPVRDFGGVIMTPDHKVLTTQGWIENQYIKSEQAINFYEAQRKNKHGWESLRTVNCGRFTWQRWKASLVELPLRLRQGCQEAWESLKKLKESVISILRQAMPSFCRVESSPWDESASNSYDMAHDDSTMHESKSERVQKLWRPWNHSLQAMASFREFLGRYGSWLCSQVDARSNKQLLRIFQKELSLGYAQSECQQQAQQCFDRYSMGQDEPLCRSRPGWNSAHNLRLPVQKRNARRAAVHEDRNEEVFDIINCGPRHQFVVEGSGGQQFIVHNCIQATARDAFYEKLVAIEEAGIPTLFAVHDEVVTDEIHPSQVDEAEEYVAEIMCADCEWMPGVRLDSEHFATPYYKK